jgi:hypothetical protein
MFYKRDVFYFLLQATPEIGAKDFQVYGQTILVDDDLPLSTCDQMIACHQFYA